MKKIFTLLCASVLLISYTNATVFTVNSLAATNTGSGNSGTLYYCMNIATITPGGPHTIAFSVAGTIAIGSNANVLPAITSTGLTIDGTTAPGYAGTPLIIIDGTGTTSGNGLSISAASCTILGLDITNSAFRGINITSTANGFRIGSATGGCVVRNSGYYGIQVNNANNGIIEGCRIGVDATGTTCQMNQYDGIDIQGGGSHQLLNNHIACNGYNGIQLGGTSNNIIKGNIIGPLMGSCTFNGYRGIDVENGSTNNIIGGTSPSDANKIAGNDYWGIEVKNVGTIGNIISGNSMSCNAYAAIDVNTGGNNNILPPVISTANGTTVSGTSAANATIEIFRAQDATVFGCSSTPQQQGADYLGSTTANGTGNWTLTGTFNGYLVATQRTVDGTSAFSNGVNTGVTAVWDNGCSGPVAGSGSAPVANFTFTDTICAGDCIDFTDLSTNNPTGWSWVFGGGNPSTSTTQDPIGICFNTAGNFNIQLTASNANGSGSSSMNLVVVALPSGSITQTGSVLYAPSGYAGYQWNLNGNPVSGATADSLAITVNGNYTCDITNAAGCQATLNITVTNMSVTTYTLYDVHVYPNPAGESFTLDLGRHLPVFTKLEITDLAGKLVYSTPLTSSVTQVTAGNLCPGMYLLKLSGSETHQQILIRK